MNAVHTVTNSNPAAAIIAALDELLQNLGEVGHKKLFDAIQKILNLIEGIDMENLKKNDK